MKPQRTPVPTTVLRSGTRLAIRDLPVEPKPIEPESAEQLESQRAELLVEKELIDIDILRIREQLEKAKSRVWSEGEYSDPQWYQRATTALRVNGQRSQRVQRIMGELGKRIRKMHNADFDRCFIDAARAALDSPTFDSVWNAAKKLSAERGA